MARINIEESIFKDVRFINLIMKLDGNTDMALGCLVRAWMIAQKYFLKKEFAGLITEKKWKKHGLSDFIVEVGLAEKRDQGIYLCGSKKQFKWLIESSAAGKRSVETRKRKYGTAKPGKTLKVLGRSQKVSEPLTPYSYSLLSSLSPSQNSNSNSNTGIPETDVSATQKTCSLVWQSYREAYLTRYGVEPSRNATVNSQIKSFVKRVGDDAPKIAEFYVTHQNSFYVRSMHDFGVCLKDAHALRTQWLKGRQITGADIKRFEKAQEHQSILESIDREGI